MPSTHLSLHYHLVFSTKNREPSMPADLRGRIHEYLGGTIRGMNGDAHAVGGTSDHIHVFAGLRATHCLADVMRELKSESSGWIHRELRLPSFQWQEGYGGFVRLSRPSGALGLVSVSGGFSRCAPGTTG
jgi:REP element-mobilizing transposase RayT